MPTCRLNLVLPETARERLEVLRDETGADSAAEVVRRALLLYDALFEATRDSGSIVVRTADGEREVLVPELDATRRTAETAENVHPLRNASR